MPDNSPTVEAIDALLPQTQCGLCEYDGCKPYAEAMCNGEEFDHCLPGGVKTLRALGELLGKDPEPYVAEMEQKAKPPLLVSIREDECIGCTKCIQACPVDAILGAGKLMHTVIADRCTGCELCIEPCPVDCIDLFEVPEKSEDEQKRMADVSRTRYEARNARLVRDQQEDAQQHRAAKRATDKKDTLAARKAAIAEAVARAKKR